MTAITGKLNVVVNKSVFNFICIWRKPAGAGLRLNQREFIYEYR
ncbi:hypothetical prophage protein [Citrobacter rodentium ICC168]|uniref:Hypothetical prophage protein n=1 Tax=Citrobacter rodentium (strain ICC168) TaxID=637910 RepID=D2TJ61_CITRI|nr:hypothetical prophage protein [Citrobacter rodentium ICC168]